MAEALVSVAGAEPAAVNKQNMAFELDGGVAHRAAIGLVVLATDNTIEHEFRQMLRIDGVAYFETRIYNSPDITPETLAEMEAGMTAAAALIMPGAPLDVMAYACTSGAMIIGEETVFERLREARPGIPCTTPITAAVAGLKALGARRIALLTPYVDEINQSMRSYIEARDIAVPVMGSYNHGNDLEVARISARSVRDAALELGREPTVDAVFVACTSIRLAEGVEALEAELGKPVTSSNHALAWHCLRLAGYDEPVPGFGRLMRTPL
jgi:maleate isomerase